MKFLKYILFLLLIAIIGLAIYIAVQPNEFHFYRSRTIKAPASMLFDKVNNYKEWPSFSPWMKQEPEAKITYGEKTSGIDASFLWVGKKLGEGSMETTAMEKDKSIAQHLVFIKPFKSESDILWTFEPFEDGTKVSWSMKGKQDFMTKMYTVFAGSIEQQTGPDFERGLFKLDSTVVASMKAYKINVEGVTEHGGGFYIYNTTSCKMEDLEVKMNDMLPKVINYAKTNGITIAGNPFILYHKWDEENRTVMFSSCVPTTAKVITTESDILTGQLNAFKTLKTTLKGNYENLKEAWDTAMMYLVENNIEIDINGPMIEAYVTDPMETINPADWITEIYIAIK